MPDFRLSAVKITAVAGLLLLLALPVRAFCEEAPAAPSAGAEAPPAGGGGYTVLPGLPAWMDAIHLNGTFEVDFAYTDKSDASDRNSDSASDFYVSTVEIDLGVDVTDWITGYIAFLAEDLGTADETDMTLDEATLTFKKGDFPLSLVVGKRVQPFGVFESRLVSDPMTQDAYETNRAGVTVAYSGPMDLELSATAYKGEEMMTHFFESELFDAGTIVRKERDEDNDVSSFVLAASVKPLGGPLTISGSFLSEPGRGDRNNTASVAAHFETDALKGLRVDGEYMKAVDRERYAGFDREFEEGVVSVTVSYEFLLKERKVTGRTLFSGEKTRVVQEPLVIAARYEHFDDDGMAAASQTASVKDRYGSGVKYSFFHDPESGLSVYVAGEYRHTEYRVSGSQENVAADSNEEVFGRIGFSF